MQFSARVTLKIALIGLILSPGAWTQPVSGSIQVGSAKPLKIQDGWVGTDCTPRFLNVYLVPYQNSKAQLDQSKPYVQVCAWFKDDKPDLSKIKMATLTVHGIPEGSESKYSWNDPVSARQMLQQFHLQGGKWHLASTMKNATSPYPRTAPGSWQLDVTVAAPKTR